MKEYNDDSMEEIKEQNKLQEILSNKKIAIPGIILVGALALFLLLSPTKEKKVKEIKGADPIATEDLQKKTEEEQNIFTENSNNIAQNQTYDENDNQNQEVEMNNLQNPPDYYTPNSVGNENYQYGNYSNPPSYSIDEIPDENISNERTVAGSNKRRNLKVKIERKVEQGTQSEEIQEQNEEQPTNSKKEQQTKTQNRFRLNQKLERPRTEYILQTGAEIPAILSDSVNSDLPGSVRAVVQQDVYDSIRQKYLLIPKGSRLYGIYDSNIIYGQDRLVLIWQRLILPNGMTIDLEAMQGSDITGQVGVKGKVNNHTLKLLRSIVMSSFVNFFSSGLSVSAQKNLNKNTSVRATVGQNVADETANNIKNAGDGILERDLNRQPTIKIKSGSKFKIIVNADMELYPYNKLRGRK